MLTVDGIYRSTIYCASQSPGLLSFFCPCYQLGKNAEAVGYSCFLWGSLSVLGIIGMGVRRVLRRKIREQRGIDVGTDRRYAFVLNIALAACLGNNVSAMPSNTYTAGRTIIYQSADPVQ